MLIFNFGEWDYWAPENLPDTPGPQKVTFDGPNKLILVNQGETDINVRVDIYSNWKEWTMQQGTIPNSAYPEAITAIGGDPITASVAVGITYFLENGWRIKMWEGSHQLIVNGNLYTREIGGDPYIEPDGNYKVTIVSTRSNLVDLITPQVALTSGDIAAVAANTAEQVWEISALQANNAGTMGRVVNTTKERTEKTLTKNEFIALQ